MKSLFNSIYTRLFGDEYINTELAERIFEGFAVDGTLPYVTIEVEQRTDENLQSTGARYYDVSIEVNAATDAERHYLSKLIISSLERQQWTDSNVYVSGVKLVSQNAAVSGDTDSLYYANDLSFEFLASD